MAFELPLIAVSIGGERGLLDEDVEIWCGLANRCSYSTGVDWVGDDEDGCPPLVVAQMRNVLRILPSVRPMGNNDQVERVKWVLADAFRHFDRLGATVGTSIPISKEDEVVGAFPVEEEDGGLFCYRPRLGGAVALLGERTAHSHNCIDSPWREVVFDRIAVEQLPKQVQSRSLLCLFVVQPKGKLYQNRYKSQLSIAKKGIFG